MVAEAIKLRYHGLNQHTGDFMKKTALLALLALTGCAAVAPEPFQGPSGKQAYSMKCGRDWINCYNDAGRLCPNGYNIIDQSTGNPVLVPVGNSVAAVSKKHMAVECK